MKSETLRKSVCRHPGQTLAQDCYMFLYGVKIIAGCLVSVDFSNQRNLALIYSEEASEAQRNVRG